MSFTWHLPPLVALPSPVPLDEGTRDLYGYDIYFKDGNLPVTGGGDYIRVGGIENLKAAIYRRLITRPGEFRFRPSYGVGVQNFVKKARSQANLDALKTRIIDQLSQDRRIQSASVEINTASVNGAEVVRVAITVVAGGQTHQFEPFNFAENA